MNEVFREGTSRHVKLTASRRSCQILYDVYLTHFDGFTPAEKKSAVLSFTERLKRRLIAEIDLDEN